MDEASQSSLTASHTTNILGHAKVLHKEMRRRTHGVPKKKHRRVIRASIGHVEFDRALAAEWGRSSRLPACAEACDHCCYLWIEATQSEASLVALFIFQNYEKILGVLKKRLKRQAQEMRSVYPDKLAYLKLGVPCAFLANNRCMIYEVRPLNCRAHHSMNSEPCAEPEALIPKTQDIVEFVQDFGASYMIAAEGINSARIKMNPRNFMFPELILKELRK